MTPQEAKQKAIIEAYGEHWNTVKHHVNDDGWLYHPKGGEVTFDPFIGFMDEHPTDDAYRPRSLHGIEVNNFWTRIEPDGSNLPKDMIDCFCIKDGLIFFPLLYRTDLMQFQAADESCYDWQEFSHYQKITEPSLPIY